ncbi:MAG: hypothetical protein LIP01_14155, partial [Tannerellaceae bacterium]|nr:hypothetical protein [Tannerellaceae bacterium]
VYRIMSNGESDSDKYEELSSFIYAYNCEYFYYDYEYDTDNILNSYGFWGRRYNEGNHRDIYYILKRIDRFYNNDGY